MAASDELESQAKDFESRAADVRTEAERTASDLESQARDLRDKASEVAALESTANDALAEADAIDSATR